MFGSYPMVLRWYSVIQELPAAALIAENQYLFLKWL